MKVLSVQTTHACHREIAEGFAHHYGQVVIQPYGAGTHLTAPHPLTVGKMRERGADVCAQHAQRLDEVTKQLDLVVTVCDQAAESSPAFRGAGEAFHSPLFDLVQVAGATERLKEAFVCFRDEMEARVR